MLSAWSKAWSIYKILTTFYNLQDAHLAQAAVNHTSCVPGNAVKFTNESRKKALQALKTHGQQTLRAESSAWVGHVLRASCASWKHTPQCPSWIFLAYESHSWVKRFLFLCSKRGQHPRPTCLTKHLCWSFASWTCGIFGPSEASCIDVSVRSRHLCCEIDVQTVIVYQNLFLLGPYLQECRSKSMFYQVLDSLWLDSHKGPPSNLPLKEEWELSKKRQTPPKVWHWSLGEVPDQEEKSGSQSL